MGSNGLAAPQSSNLRKVEISSKAYVVYSVLFAWDSSVDPAQVLKDFSRIVTSELGITISVKAFTFRPRSPQPSYDERPPLRMITEVISELPAKAGSANTELIAIFSSMLVPTAQGGSQAYFMRYVTGVGDRNVAIIWGRDASAPWFPAKASLLPYVLAHEFGHFLGYQHENDLRCLMFPSPREATGFKNCLQYSAQPASAKPIPNPLAQSPPSGPGSANSAAVKGQCIIATTAFGSELAPPVAFLRSFRDSSVSTTYRGKGFIATFNAWYYSFSPYIANRIGMDPIARESTKAAIYPLVAILSSAAAVQPFFANELGLAVAGTMAAFALGLIYLGPIVFLAAVPFTRVSSKTHAALGFNPILWAPGLLALSSDGLLSSAGAVWLVLIASGAGAIAGSALLRRLIGLLKIRH